jgi:S1-C subfamily serine protease
MFDCPFPNVIELHRTQDPTMTDEERERLRRRVERTFGTRELSQIMKPVRALVGPRMPAGEETAEKAREKLANGVEPTPSERAALEVMIRLLRPALLYGANMFDALPLHNEYGAELRTLWDSFRAGLGSLAFSVGRIDTADGVKIGTGFLVAEDRLVTNDHVLDALSYGTFVLERGQGFVRFQQRWDPADTEDPVPIVRVIATDPDLDIAILEIEPQANAPHAPFLLSDVDSADGDFVAVLGYPLKDGGRNPAFMEALFESRYGVKRGAPGEIVKTDTSLAFHDCSTLGGNSGSPVLSLKTGKVVGLHRSGTFMFRNEAVQATALREFVSAH